MIKCLESLLGERVKCTHANFDKDDVYTVFEIDKKSNKAKIQDPSDRSGRWVDVKYLNNK